MSRFRKVDPRIWNDQKFRRLSDRGKLSFLMLITHPNMTALGAMRATLPGLAAELGWTTEAFREAFGEASAEGLAELDEEASLIALPNFIRYNAPESPNVIRAWTGAVDLIPESPLKSATISRARSVAMGMSPGFRKAFEEAFGIGCGHPMPNKKQEPEPEKKTPSQERKGRDLHAGARRHAREGGRLAPAGLAGGEADF